MARRKEFMKRNEARILIFLKQADMIYRHGQHMSEKLNIDYVYVMKLLDAMFNKGWVAIHEYNGKRYFRTTVAAPMLEAKDRLQ